MQLDASYAGNGSDIQNRASVIAAEIDPVPANNTSPPATPIVGPASADVSLTKAVVEPAARPGELFTYRIVVSNAGPSTALGVMVPTRCRRRPRSSTRRMAARPSVRR